VVLGKTPGQCVNVAVGGTTIEERLTYISWRPTTPIGGAERFQVWNVVHPACKKVQMMELTKN